MHLDEVRVQVFWRYCDLNRNTPIQHAGPAAEAIPGSQLHSFPGEGHVSLVIKYFGSILEAVMGK